MNITRIIVGELETNCYLLEKEGNCLIIDPGAEYKRLKKYLKDKNLVGIIITHRHFDHIGALKELLTDYNIPIIDNTYKEEIITISTFQFKLLKTYGHTMDSITIYFEKEKIMFTGDFLFKGTIGRCDFIESNIEEMKKNLNKIKQYPSDITIYPGHGEISTLKHEFTSNYYLKSNSI